MSNSHNNDSNPNSTSTPGTDAPGLHLELTPLKPAVCESQSLSLDVLVRVQAPEQDLVGAPPAPRTPLAIALIIDRSGSMQGAELEAAKGCARDVVMRLHPEDDVSIVVYDDEVQVVMPLGPVAQARASVDAVLACIAAGGSTDLHSGWLAGAQQLAPRTGSGRLCRVILLSDGQANHGITDEGAITEQVRLLAQSGVTTTTVGLGHGFNESLMTAMAKAGQGTALYGERAEDLAEPFESELGLLAHLAWRDVRLTMGSATSRWQLLNDYARSAEGAWTLPSIPQGAEAFACFSVPMKSALAAQARSRQGKAFHVTVSARDAVGVEHTFKASLAALPVVDKAAWRAMPADELVARRLAEVRAAGLQRQAREAVQRLDWVRVEQLLDKVRDLAREQPWIQGTVAQLEAMLRQRDHVRMSKELTYSSMKMAHRISGIEEEADLNLVAESAKPAYLRRKSLQGRSGPV